MTGIERRRIEREKERAERAEKMKPWEDYQKRLEAARLKLLHCKEELMIAETEIIRIKIAWKES